MIHGSPLIVLISLGTTTKETSEPFGERKCYVCIKRFADSTRRESRVFRNPNSNMVLLWTALGDVDRRFHTSSSWTDWKTYFHDPSFFLGTAQHGFRALRIEQGRT